MMDEIKKKKALNSNQKKEFFVDIAGFSPHDFSNQEALGEDKSKSKSPRRDIPKHKPPAPPKEKSPP